MFERISNSLAELTPKEFRKERIYPMLEFAGISEDFDIWLGKKILFSVLFGLIGFLLPLTFLNFFQVVFLEPYHVIFLSLFLFVLFSVLAITIFYLHLFYVIEGRSQRVEEILPDFLSLVASNIRAGMTPFSAFRQSSMDEFGPLAEEVKIATSKSLGTESFTHALRELSIRIRSRNLSETVSFFAQSIRSGGHIAKLLETTSNDLRRNQALKKELQSSTRMYVLFVVFVVLVATPLLLSVSVLFLEMINQVQSQITVAPTAVGQIGFLSSELLVSTDFMRLIAFFLLAVNSFMGSLFIGLLETGKEKLGLRYFPLMVIVSFALFFVSTAVLSGILKLNA